MTQALKLIGETDFADYDILREKNEHTGEVSYKIKGPYLMADSKNGNGRIYPYDILKTEADDYIANKVNTNSALGELEHPDYTYVNLERACHKITALREDNKTWIGESIILTGTPTGDIVSSLLKHKARIGMSTRGVGSLQEGKFSNGTPVAKYKLICVDTVADPSIGKYVDGILEEKAFMINTHGMIIEAKFDLLENQLKVLPNTTTERREYINNIVHEFLRTL